MGRRIYEQGILPDNSLLTGKRPEGFELKGDQAACSNCHRRSGMGGIEGVVSRITLVPPIAAPVLFKPGLFSRSYLDTARHYVPTKAWERVMKRPAYDDTMLARALRKGVDPTGKPLLPPMMRYELDKKSMAALIAYLHQLSSQPTPGLIKNRLHVATVITPDVPAEQADAVIGVVKAWMKRIRPFNKQVDLHIWRLHGETSDWTHQLTQFYQQQPVFAVISGVGGARWQPVQQFCETQSVPCILPSVEVTPEDNDSPEKEQPYFSMYYSSGVTLEARLLATYMEDQSAESGAPSSLVQIYSDDTGEIASQRVRKFTDFAQYAQRDRRLSLMSPASALSGLGKQDSVMLWLRPEEIQMLGSVWKAPSVKHIYISALLAPPGSATLPDSWKARVAYVSLFDDMGVQGQIAKVRLKRWLAVHHLTVTNLRLQADAYAACYLFNAAMSRIRRQEVRRPAVPLNRDQVLEMLETLVAKYDDGTQYIDEDSHVAFYGHMSLGPEQRFAVRGGNIQRYAAPDYKHLVAASDRIVPR